MSCSPFDLRDYFLKELAGPEHRQVELHVRGCRSCQEELERLQITESALLSLREEEIPQRIGFVSDKIFEPSPWRRAWEAFWDSSARLGLASAALLSIALVAFGWLNYRASRPAPAPAAALAAPAISPAELRQQIQAAVAQAVELSEARQEKRMEQRVSELRQLIVWNQEERDLLQRKQLLSLRSNYGPPKAENGEAK